MNKDRELDKVYADWLPPNLEQIVGITSHQDFVLVATNRCVYRMHYDWLKNNMAVDRRQVTTNE